MTRRVAIYACVVAAVGCVKAEQSTESQYAAARLVFDSEKQALDEATELLRAVCINRSVPPGEPADATLKTIADVDMAIALVNLEKLQEFADGDPAYERFVSHLQRVERAKQALDKASAYLNE